MTIEIVETVQMPLDQLEAAPYNPRRDLQPGDKEYRDIERSLKRWGLVEPLVWNRRSSRLVGGHQRLKVLRAEGLERAPVTVVDLDDQEEAALNVALNKIAGEWHMPKLQDVFGQFENFDASLTDSTRRSWRRRLPGARRPLSRTRFPRHHRPLLAASARSMGWGHTVSCAATQRHRRRLLAYLEPLCRPSWSPIHPTALTMILLGGTRRAVFLGTAKRFNGVKS